MFLATDVPRLRTVTRIKLSTPCAGLAAKYLSESEPILLAQETSRIEINAPVTHTGEGIQAIAGGDVNITYKTSGVSQEQFNQLTEELNVSRAAAVRFLKTLDEKDVALEERGAQFEALLKKYKELEQRLVGRDDAVSIEAGELLAEGKLDEADSLLKESFASRLKNLRYLDRQREKQKKLAAAEASGLGGIQELKLDYKEALDYYHKAVELDPDNSTYLNDLGFIEHDLGHYKKAIGLYEQALAINREIYGEKHPSVARDLNSLAVAWNALGKHKKAIGLFKKVLAILTDVLGLEHPITQTVAENLQQAQEAAGE